MDVLPEDRAAPNLGRRQSESGKSSKGSFISKDKLKKSSSSLKSSRGKDSQLEALRNSDILRESPEGSRSASSSEVNKKSKLSDKISSDSGLVPKKSASEKRMLKNQKILGFSSSEPPQKIGPLGADSKKDLPQPPKKVGTTESSGVATGGALSQSTGSPVTTRVNFTDPGDYKTEANDETVEFIHRPFDEFPDELKEAIISQGIIPEDVTGKRLDYLWHIVWFLNRKNFDSDFVVYNRALQLPAISDEAKENTSKLVKVIDTPMKKIFPSLDFSASGGFGQVFVGKMKVDKKKKLRIAIKKLPQNNVKEKSANLTEVFFLSKLSHPNIVKFEGSFFWNADPTSKKEDEQTDHMIIAMEWLEGGTLHQAARAGARFTDHHLAFIAKECFKALDYLHTLRFIHRDLKSANIMLSIQGEVKLIDFGLACDLSLGRRNRMQGSPMWISPEMIQCRPHGSPADIWSMGVCMLEFYLGGPPMKRTPIQCMYTAATQGFAHLIPENASPLARAFIAECLTPDPDRRPSASELLKHKWIAPIQGESKGIKEILRSIFLAKNLSSVGF